MNRIVISNVRIKPLFGGEELITKLITEGLSGSFDVRYIGYPFDIKVQAKTFPFSKFLPKISGVGNLLRRLPILKYIFVKNLKMNCDLLISNSNSDDLALLRGGKHNVSYGKIIIIKHGPIFEFGKIYPDPLIKTKKFKILALNTTDMEELSNRYGNSNVDLLRLGIDVNTANSHPNPKYFEELGISSDSKVIFSIGRLEERQKGFLKGILAMREILDINKNKENFVYLIAGSGKDRKLYQNTISRLGLRNNVKLLGKISDELKRQLYTRADFILQPSGAESFSLVALEALKYGKILLVSKNKGSVDIIKDSGTDQNGFFIERDAKNIANLLISITGTLPPYDLSLIRQNALKTGALFTADKMLNDIRKVIDQMLSSGEI